MGNIKGVRKSHKVIKGDLTRPFKNYAVEEKG